MISIHSITKALGRKKALAAAIPLIMAAQAQGIEYYAGDVAINLDTRISMGSSWRVENQNSTLTGDINANNGDLNYKKNDAFSQVFKGSNELQVSYENYGAFVQAKYWYDAALENDDSLDDSNHHELQKFSGAQVLDAFVYGDFEVFDMPLDLRLGKQALSWGESTFITGSIDTINPFDVSAFNRPGAKLKEAVIPVNMAFANIGITDNLSAEMFYQLEFHETVLDGCGTYFSATDFAGQGCDDIDAEFGGLMLVKDNDFVRRPDSDGQYGLALRYVSEALDTEFGFFAMNIHSRNPTVGGAFGGISPNDQLNTYIATVSNPATAAAADAVAFGITGERASDDYNAILGGEIVGAGFYDVAAANLASASYFVEYPEDIKIAGISFATTVGSLAFSGEVSHQKDVPFNVNAYQAIGSFLTGQLEVELDQLPVDPDPTLNLNLPLSDPYYAGIPANASGTDSKGYDLFDVTQVQLTAIQLFDQVLGANTIFVIAEAGYTFNHGFDEDGATKYDGTANVAINPLTATPFTDANGNIIVSGSVTESAWGYRALVGAEYSNVIAGVSLTPEIFWSHDVKGISSLGGSAFMEGNQRLGLTLNADYLNTYNASLSYTRYSGEQDDVLSDRDYAAISVGMQF